MTAAAIGAITGAVIVIGQRSITDWVTAGLALVTVALALALQEAPRAADRRGGRPDRPRRPPADDARLNTPKEFPWTSRHVRSPFRRRRSNGLSERLLASHHANNYTGAVKRLNAIRAQLAALDFASAPGFQLNGLKREELVATNSMLLHELYFDSLGGDGQTMVPAMTLALDANFGSVDRWRAEFVAMGKALGGGSGWVLLTVPAARRNAW